LLLVLQQCLTCLPAAWLSSVWFGYFVLALDNAVFVLFIGKFRAVGLRQVSSCHGGSRSLHVVTRAP